MKRKEQLQRHMVSGAWNNSSPPFTYLYLQSGYFLLCYPCLKMFYIWLMYLVFCMQHSYVLFFLSHFAVFSNWCFVFMITVNWKLFIWQLLIIIIIFLLITLCDDIPMATKLYSTRLVGSIILHWAMFVSKDGVECHKLFFEFLPQNLVFCFKEMGKILFHLKISKTLSGSFVNLVSFCSIHSAHHSISKHMRML